MAFQKTLTPETLFPVTMPNGEPWPHTVFLKNFIDHPNIEIGDWTYYNDFRKPIEDYAQVIAPYLHPGCPEKLTIGKFCQLAHGMQFITSSANHQLSGFTTYPFFVFNKAWSEMYTPNLPFKGDTVVGHDVWIGHQALIMPGVTIGTGAIIGSGSVVTKDVEPYSVVAGNPACVIKKRFSESVIQGLLALAWWDWPIEVIQENLSALTSGDLTALEQAL